MTPTASLLGFGWQDYHDPWCLFVACFARFGFHKPGTGVIRWFYFSGTDCIEDMKGNHTLQNPGNLRLPSLQAGASSQARALYTMLSGSEAVAVLFSHSTPIHRDPMKIRLAFGAKQGLQLFSAWVDDSLARNSICWFRQPWEPPFTKDTGCVPATGIYGVPKANRPICLLVSFVWSV